MFFRERFAFDGSFRISDLFVRAERFFDKRNQIKGVYLPMKRTLATLLVITILCFASAYAETTETTIPEIVFDETTAAYEGTWLTFDDDGFMVYLPSDWIDADVTDEMAASGTYYAATSADGAYAMTVSYAETEATTNDEIAAQLTEAGYENVTQLNLNGIDVVGYDITEQDVSGMTFADGAGGMYIFSFMPSSDEAFAAIGQTIVSSLSPIEPEATAAE